MADDLTTLDEGQLTPDQMAATEHNARWAQAFGRSSDPRRQPAPNLMRRYRNDVSQFNEDLLRQAEDRQKELIRTNRTAQSFYFRSKELAAKDEAAKEARTRADELHQLRLETEKSKQDAQHALELERIAREKEISDRTTRDALSRTELIGKWDALNKSGLEPGSGEFANRAMDILVRHGKALDPQTRKMITDRAHVTSEDDPVEAATQAVAGWEAIHSTLNEKGIKAKVTGRLLPSGKMGFSLSEENPTDTRLKQIDKQLPSMESEWRREKMKLPKKIPLVETAIDALRKERSTLTPAVGMGDEKAAEAPASLPNTAAPQPVASPLRKVIRAEDGTLSFAP